MKRIKLLLVMLIAVLCMAGCSKEKDNDEKDSKSATSTSESYILPNTDRQGQSIKVPENINKIISLAPASTQILVELGYGDKLIAIDSYSVQIEGINSAILSFDMMAPDVEKLAELEPDIIYVSSMTDYEGNDIFKVLKDIGICVAVIPTSNTIEDIEKDIYFIANTLRADEKGKEIVTSMEKEIATIKETAATITDRKRVHFEISAAPYIYTFGKGVYLDEMLEIIGADNVYGDKEGWLSVSEESAVSANPDVILTNVNYIEDAVGEIMTRTAWQEVTAIKTKAVYYIDSDNSNQPCHNIIKALKDMAKAVYPEYYK